MTFDGLEHSKDCSDFVAATKGNDVYRALAVPATSSLGPWTAELLLKIEGIEEAIQKNEWMTEDRRRFLIE